MYLPASSPAFLSSLLTAFTYLFFPHLAREGTGSAVNPVNHNPTELLSSDAWNGEFGLEDFSFDTVPEDMDDLSPDDDLSATVVINGCPGLKFKPLTYQRNGRAQGYFQLENADSLQPAYFSSPTPACGNVNRPYGYGREHIYEVQLIAAFIEHLVQQYPKIWQQYGQTKCGYVGNYILKAPVPGTVAPIRDLLECLPYSAQPSGALMPWLDNLANGMKASAFSDKSLRQEATFTASDPTKKVMIMRAAAGLMSYMTNDAVKQSILTQSRCIRGVWKEWKAAYNATVANPSDPLNGTDIETFYNAWITERVTEFGTNVKGGLADMVMWWETQYQQTSQQVKYDYSCMYNRNGPFPTSVDKSFFGNLTNFVTNNPLNWIADLSQ